MCINLKGKYYWKFQSVIQEVLSEQTRCIVCGSKKNLSIHHIVHTDSNEERYADKDNIVVMCRECHNYYHNRYPKDCNLLTFIDFVKDYAEMEMYSLQSEIDDLKKERAEYLDLINYIIQIQ